MGEVAVGTEIRLIMGTSTSLLILGKFFSSPGLNFFFYEIEIQMNDPYGGITLRGWTLLKKMNT